jgi:hypothetical protein
MSERYRAELLLHPEGEWTFYADSLDAAWAEAEAALPDADWRGPTLNISIDGWDAMAWNSQASDEVVLASGDTPAAALRALAARLRRSGS